MQLTPESVRKKGNNSWVLMGGRRGGTGGPQGGEKGEEAELCCEKKKGWMEARKESGCLRWGLKNLTNVNAPEEEKKKAWV